jgi:hypothetical protein
MDALSTHNACSLGFRVSVTLCACSCCDCPCQLVCAHAGTVDVSLCAHATRVDVVFCVCMLCALMLLVSAHAVRHVLHSCCQLVRAHAVTVDVSLSVHML